MSELLLVHRPFSNNLSNGLSNNLNISNNQSDPNQFDQKDESPFLVWKTCLRQIFFLDRNDPLDFKFQREDQIFVDLEAEIFLAEVLCGLKSPLIGETEVFGQFKLWWKAVPEHQIWKKKHQSRIEKLFSLVKNVRENVLCGHGSQSYGSLLRRHLKESSSQVDIIGNGHLAQEIGPWIQNKAAYRIWARDPQKVSFSMLGKKAEKIFQLNDRSALSNVVIVAAPLSHDELNFWLSQRNFGADHTLFDFRSDSNEFVPFVAPKFHLKLGDFSSQHEEHRYEIEQKAQNAQILILQWKEKQESKIQVRPYGWDDL